MPTAALPESPLAGIRTIELTLDHAAALQKFFEENPAYFLATSGEPAGPDEGLEEITGEVPAGWSFTKKWVVGYVDANDSLIALADIITDLLAPTVFHIGTFIVATARHGSGDAQFLYRGLEQWSVANGAAWMRLGVVVGNVRAERFWASTGFISFRERHGIQMGKRMTTVRNMVKPLRGGGLQAYFDLVPRDRPEGANAL